jgi:L-lactate transport
MSWPQTYFLFGWGLGVSATLAATPIFTLLFLLGVLRKPAWLAGLIGLGVTFLLAVVGYHMPPLTALSAACNGAAFGLFPISWIIFWAILLFRVAQEGGQFEIIKSTIGRLTPDPRLQAILIAFAFGAFLEGAAGFGAPVAIASTMLTGLGFPAFTAAAICLVANTAPVAFGSIGIPVITLAGTTALPVQQLSTDIGRLCTPVVLIMPMYLIAATWGFRALRGIWLPVVLTGTVFAAAQLLVSSYMGPQLTDILASLLTMASLIVLLRLWHPNGCQTYASAPNVVATPSPARDPASSYTTGAVLFAWLPYIFLVGCVLLWGFAPVQRRLNVLSFTFPWPFLHDVVWRMPPISAAPAPYPAVFRVNWLSAAGTACAAATLLTAASARMAPRRFLRLLASVAHQLILPTITVTSVLGVAFLMNYCGATATLGLAFAAAGAAFPFFSAVLGWLGVFLTGSDTASNALFGNLQVLTAGRLGLDRVLMAAANSVGGVMGKMISLQTIAVAAAATGMSLADQARLFRFTLKHSLLLVSLVGVAALLFAYL